MFVFPLMFFEPLRPSAARWRADKHKHSCCIRHNDVVTVTVLSVCTSSHVNHGSARCVRTCTAHQQHISVCVRHTAAPPPSDDTCVFGTSNICLLDAFQTTEQSVTGRGDALVSAVASTKVARLLCNHQACTHVPSLRVSQYMEQMAGRVLNKHKYILVISLGYRQLLQLILPLALDV